MCSLPFCACQYFFSFAVCDISLPEISLCLDTCLCFCLSAKASFHDILVEMFAPPLFLSHEVKPFVHWLQAKIKELLSKGCKVVGKSLYFIVTI